MRDRQPHTITGIAIAVALTCMCGCTSLRPLEPGGIVYPPGKHLRYDEVPAHSRVVGIPVTGLRGDPSQLRITIRDEFNPAVVFDSEVNHSPEDGYVLYRLQKSLLSDRRAEAGITNPPGEIIVEIEDKRDPKEGFMSRWFRWWGRSDSEAYFIMCK